MGPERKVVIGTGRIDAVIFDMDGVVTDTARSTQPPGPGHRDRMATRPGQVAISLASSSKLPTRSPTTIGPVRGGPSALLRPECRAYVERARR
jgi:hypothetical protein